MIASPDTQNGDGAEELERANKRLSEWAARSAADSETLIARFEEMGYAVRGKSEEEIAEVLRQPPDQRG